MHKSFLFFPYIEKPHLPSQQSLWWLFPDPESNKLYIFS